MPARPSPDPSTPHYHHGDLKDTLLAFARERLEGAGLDSLSMREMAKAVGVSHTAAYRHFADKQSLLDAVAEQGFSELLQACREAVANIATHPPASDLPLVACGLAYIRFGRQSPRLLSHMFSAATRTDAPAGLRAEAAQLFDLLMELVSQGQTEGRFQPGDTRTLAHSCWAMVHGLAQLQAAQWLPPIASVRGKAVKAGMRDAQASEQARQALTVLMQGLLRA